MIKLRASGLIRFVIALGVSIIGLPTVLFMYLRLSPGASSRDFLDAFTQIVPFGEKFCPTIVSVWGEAQSGLDNALQNLEDHLTFAIEGFELTKYLTLELAEMIFTGMVMLILTALLGKKFVISTDGGLLNNIANALLQLDIAFVSSLLISFVFTLYRTELAQLEGIWNDVLTVILAGLAGGGGFVLMLIVGILWFRALVLIGINCLKLFLSYLAMCWLLVATVLGGSVIITAVGLALWVGTLWLVLEMEKMFLPSNG